MAANEMMSNSELSDICAVCGTQVEVFNQNVSFSMELHMQSHKSLDSVAADFSSSYDMKQSTVNPLNEIFKTTSKSVRLHRDFICLNKESKAVCTVCDLIISDLSLMIAHLKSATHERKVIDNLKKLIPSKKLQESLYRITFVKSNLNCTLCKCNIRMNSGNMFETIVNVFLHNSSPEHISRVNNSPKDNGEKKTNSTITPASHHSKNKTIVEHNAFLLFRCLRCDYQIKCGTVLNKSKNKSDYYPTCKTESTKSKISNFVCKEFDISHVDGDSAHKCIATNGVVFCTLCDAESSPLNIDQLICHVLGADKQENDMTNSELTKQLGNVSISCHSSAGEHAREVASRGAINKHLSALLNSLPDNLTHVQYLSQTEDGSIVCIVCNCKVPPACSNIETHLKGNIHKKKLVKSFLNQLPSQYQNETCISVNGDLHILCSTCKCTIQPDATSLELHLKGHDHKKNALLCLLPQELHHLDCLILTEEKKIVCTACGSLVRLSSIKHHLKEEVHKQNVLHPLISNYEHFSFITLTDLSEFECSVCNVTFGMNTIDVKSHLETNHGNPKEQSQNDGDTKRENTPTSLSTDNEEDVMCSLLMLSCL